MYSMLHAIHFKHICLNKKEYISVIHTLFPMFVSLKLLQMQKNQMIVPISKILYPPHFSLKGDGQFFCSLERELVRLHSTVWDNSVAE